MKLIKRLIFVKGLKIDAAIGIYDHEHGRNQPLIIDATIELDHHEIKTLSDTLNYELVGKIAREHIGNGHIKLVETLAQDVAKTLINLPHVIGVELSISKPQALKDADHAGVCVIYSKTQV